MQEINIIGVSRGSEYSPNHVGNDAAIFNKVVEELRRLGCKVHACTEKEYVASDVEGDVIFDMARDAATLRKLKHQEDKGCLVINSAYGIDNCIRKPMTELLLAHGVPYPPSVIAPTDRSYSGEYLPCWIKRGDSHAMIKEDVSYVTTREEADAVLRSFHSRGIAEAVVNKHLQGDLVKFYGVKDTDFFFWFYPGPCSHSKFGLEAINGEATGIPFDANELKRQSDKAAEILNVPVYGGDCVILSDGRMEIIDFNDWPSFARCREEAGVKIAEYIYRQAQKKLKL